MYILHGRDHFTVAFITPNSLIHLNADSSADKKGIQFELVHWNGLPPAGPRVTLMKITAPSGPCGAVPPTAAEGVGVEYKPVVGSIDSIIQADPSDKSKFPKQWQLWTYEVALAIDDPSNQSPVRPTHLPQPEVFSLDPKDASRDDTPWRCRSCYEVL